MGKNLKGKELGVGISQRKDGFFVGRYTNNQGKRVQKVFRTLPECKQWIADSEYMDEHTNIDVPQNMTLDAWFNYWINIKKRTVRDSSVKNYMTYYRIHIQPILGNKVLSKITTMQCQQVFTIMGDKNLANTTIENVRVTLFDLFNQAYQNDVIIKNPCNRKIETKIGKKEKKREPLTIRQQQIFCESIKGKGSRCENQFLLILQTGMRIGEIMGLQWSDIDFKRKQLTINRTLLYQDKKWIIHEPKTEAGHRVIPLTEEAIRILQNQKNKNIIRNPEWSDFVFLNEKGYPLSASNYDCVLSHLCTKINLPNFSVHILRHTFATRCIEAGMTPKILQGILGHTKISMTMDLYVHATNEQKDKEINMISEYLMVQNSVQ